MYPFVGKVNLYTVNIIDFFVLIDFLYFCIVNTQLLTEFLVLTIK